MSRRILVTGSRNLKRLSVVRAAIDATGVFKWAGTPPTGDALDKHRRSIVVVAGGARGADRCARTVATQHGFTVETYDAPWDGPCVSAGKLDPLNGTPWCPPGHRKVRDDGSTYCPRAGHRRNQHMVNLGADVVLAFPIGPSFGTRDCVRRAQAAGLDVRTYEQGAAS